MGDNDNDKNFGEMLQGNISNKRQVGKFQNFTGILNGRWLRYLKNLDFCGKLRKEVFVDILIKKLRGCKYLLVF